MAKQTTKFVRGAEAQKHPAKKPGISGSNPKSRKALEPPKKKK